MIKKKNVCWILRINFAQSDEHIYCSLKMSHLFLFSKVAFPFWTDVISWALVPWPLVESELSQVLSLWQLVPVLRSHWTGSSPHPSVHFFSNSALSITVPFLHVLKLLSWVTNSSIICRLFSLFFSSFPEIHSDTPTRIFKKFNVIFLLHALSSYPSGSLSRLPRVALRSLSFII